MFKIDKLYHFIAGIIIYLFFLLFLSNVMALIPVIIIGGAKEIYDWKSKKGNPEWWDFIFTVLGGLSIFLLTL
jgi:hypothetical protein